MMVATFYTGSEKIITSRARKPPVPGLSPCTPGDNIFFPAIYKGLGLMPNSHNIDEKISLPASRPSLTRREWVQRMLVGAGAGAAAPAVAEANWGLAADAQTAARTQPAADWKPEFLDDPQNQALVALAEAIVPGSTGAQVNRFIDTALIALPRENQQSFVAALNAIEGEALRQFMKSFKDLSGEEGVQVLATASTGESANPIINAIVQSQSGVRPLPSSLRDYFEHLKTWVSMAYYSSEVGMKELGWNGESFYESYPGCEHPDGHP